MSKRIKIRFYHYWIYELFYRFWNPILTQDRRWREFFKAEIKLFESQEAADE